ncbi:hypothetical protein BDW66DRAFT_128295 [Aspergillus desertorum]
MFSTNNPTGLSSNPPRTQANPYAYEPPDPSLNPTTKADRNVTESKREQSRRMRNAKAGDKPDAFDAANTNPNSALDPQDAGVGLGIGVGTESFHSKREDTSDDELRSHP